MKGTQGAAFIRTQRSKIDLAEEILKITVALALAFRYEEQNSHLGVLQAQRKTVVEDSFALYRRTGERRA